MHVLFAERVGNQRHPRAVQAQPGQRQGGGDIGVLRVQACCLAGAAFEDHRGLVDGVQVADLLGRGVLPGPGRFAAGVVDRIQATDLGRRQRIDAADGAGQQLDAGVATGGGSLQAFDQAQLRQGPDRDDQAGDAALQRRQYVFLDCLVPGALHQQVRAGVGGQGGEHLRRALEAGQALLYQGFGAGRGDHMLDAQLRVVLQQFQHCDANGAAADHGDIEHLQVLRPWLSGLWFRCWAGRRTGWQSRRR
ncbi:hypothetical protein D3C79_782440 [compost metagenome]